MILDFLFTVLICYVGYQDGKTRRIKDSSCLFLFFLGVLSFFLYDQPSLFQRISGFFFISILLLLCNVIYPKAFGGGDIKLTAVMGFYLGLDRQVEVFFYSLLLAALYAGYLLVWKKERKQTFPLGPFLAAGLIAAIVKQLCLC